MFAVEQNNKLSLSSSAAAMPSDHEQRAGLPTLPSFFRNQKFMLSEMYACMLVQIRNIFFHIVDNFFIILLLCLLFTIFLEKKTKSFCQTISSSINILCLRSVLYQSNKQYILARVVVFGSIELLLLTAHSRPGNHLVVRKITDSRRRSLMIGRHQMREWRKLKCDIGNYRQCTPPLSYKRN